MKEDKEKTVDEKIRDAMENLNLRVDKMVKLTIYPVKKYTEGGTFYTVRVFEKNRKENGG